MQKFGLPSRVRCDKGGENVDVLSFMLSHPLCGPNRGSVLVGRSVHNQKVERMWRDIFQGVNVTGSAKTLHVRVFYTSSQNNCKVLIV